MLAGSSAWLPTMVHEERRTMEQLTQSLWQCQSLCTDCSGGLEELVNQHCPSYSPSSHQPTTLAASHPPCIVLWRETLQSCSQWASRCASFPSPNSGFTSGLKFHRRAVNPKRAQSGATITSTAHGCNSFWVDTEVCSCQSQLQQLITVTLHRVFE